MVTITNGQMTITVPNAAYETLYKPAGFQLTRDEEDTLNTADTYTDGVHRTPEITDSAEENDEEEENIGDEAEEETDVIDLSEIPLGEMDFYQLSDYADQLGIDHRGIRSKRELRTLIRNAL